MAKKFTALRAGMTQAALENADGMARQMLSDESDQELGALADAAKGAADRAASAIDDAKAFLAASNKRIASMESAAAKKAV